MTASTRVLLACTLALILVPCAQAQARKSFGAWSVVCSGGATGYCSASDRIKSVAGPYRFQLNVSRERPGAAFELALLTGYQHPGDGSVITIQVDASKPLRLSPREGYRRAGRSNTYVVAAGETERLLKQMRSGKRARFRFEDAKGAAIDAGFPLAGLSDAMGFMDKMQPVPQRRTSGAGAPTAAMPPAVEQPKPPQEREAVPGTKPAPTAKEPATARTPTPAPTVKEVTPAPTTAPAAPAKQAAGAPAPLAKEVAPAPTTAPAAPAKQAPGTSAPLAKEIAPGPSPAPAPLAKQVTPAPTAAPVPLTREVTPVPGAVPVPPVKQVAPAPVAEPAAPAKVATPAPAAAPSPVPEPKSKPAPAQTTEAALAPAPVQKPASEPRRKPAQAQKQAAVTVAPSASRKRGAKSIRQFSCRGNEPSWTFVVDGEHARYASLTEPDAIELAGKLNVTGDGPTPTIDWRGKSDWGGSFRAVVTEGRCRDNMSDSEGQTEFEYLAQVTVPGGKSVRGCCNAGLPPVKAVAPPDMTQYPVADLRNRAETDWSRYLFDLLPAIQACIDKTPEPEPYATKAWPMNRGMVGVRTRNGQGGWFECVAEANGKSIERFVTLPSGAPLAPNEDRVVFSPPDHPPPAGNCYKHERVMDGMGDFMGWLSTNGCS